MTTTLRDDYTTAVPDTLAKQLNLRPGAELEWEVDDDGLILVRVETQSRAELVKQLHELGMRHKQDGQDAVAGLIRQRIEDDDLRNETLK